MRHPRTELDDLARQLRAEQQRSTELEQRMGEAAAANVALRAAAEQERSALQRRLADADRARADAERALAEAEQRAQDAEAGLRLAEATVRAVQISFRARVASPDATHRDDILSPASRAEPSLLPPPFTPAGRMRR